MAEFPALPLWTDAYLADCSHLTDAEHGRYLLMLMQMWRAPKQRFPADDAWLARKFGRSVEAFVSEWKPIMQEHMQTDGNWWTQKRMQKEWTYVKGRSEKRRDAAKSRWNKEKDLCNSNAPTPTPTPTPTNKKERTAPLGRFDEFWLVCPKKTGRGVAEKAWVKALSLAEPQTLIDAMRAYAGTQAGKDKAFTKTPGPWLNGKHWLDEGIAPAEQIDPEKAAEAKDKADRYFKRGAYAENFQ